MDEAVLNQNILVSKFRETVKAINTTFKTIPQTLYRKAAAAIKNIHCQFIEPQSSWNCIHIVWMWCKSSYENFVSGSSKCFEISSQPLITSSLVTERGSSWMGMSILKIIVCESSKNSHAYVDKSLQPPKMGVWCTVSHDRFVGLIF